MKKCKLGVSVVDGMLIFNVIKPPSVLSVEDLDLRTLAIQRFMIRKSQKVTNEEVIMLERKHSRWAKLK